MAATCQIAIGVQGRYWRLNYGRSEFAAASQGRLKSLHIVVFDFPPPRRHPLGFGGRSRVGTLAKRPSRLLQIFFFFDSEIPYRGETIGLFGLCRGDPDVGMYRLEVVAAVLRRACRA